MRCYVGLETIQASEIFTEMVVAEINKDPAGAIILKNRPGCRMWLR
jgi:hypothetical protein